MELYNANEMPLSNDEQLRNAQIKVLNGQELSLSEKIKLGRDHPVKEYAGYKFKPDYVYRAISEDLLEIYKQTGKIIGIDSDDEYMEWEENGKSYNNNRGVDWYLGGACLRYGEIIIECPADKNYFKPAWDNGNGLSADPTIKFMKSSGFKNPVPTTMITKAFRIVKEKDKKSTPEQIQEFQIARAEDIQRRNERRQEIINSLNLNHMLETTEEQSIGGMSK